MLPSAPATHEIPYGIYQGRALHISEVMATNRGLLCDCECPACGQPLEAKLGQQRRHHFAHSGLSECTRAVESGIHRRAKEIIEEHKGLVLPGLSINVVRRVGDHIATATECLVQHGTPVAFDTVLIERCQDGFRPDVVGLRQQRQLFIEICVHHPVTPEKAMLIKAAGFSCIEIDLSALASSACPMDVESALFDPSNARWVYHAKEGISQAALYDGLQAQVDVLQAEQEAQACTEAADRAKQSVKREGVAKLAKQCADQLAVLGKMKLPRCPFVTSKGNDQLPASVWSGLSVVQHTDLLRLTALQYRSRDNTFTESLWVYWSHHTLDDSPPPALADFANSDMPICSIDLMPLMLKAERIEDTTALARLVDEFLQDRSGTALRRPEDQWLNTPKVLAPSIKMHKQDDRDARAYERQKALEATKDEKGAAYLEAATLRIAALQDGETALREIVHAANERRKAIERGRSNDGRSYFERWSSISLPEGIELSRLAVVTEGAIEQHLKPFMFPYSHEASFAVHPDYVKVALLDTVISQYGQPAVDGGRFVVDTERLQEAYHQVLTSLTPSGAVPWPSGASSLSAEWQTEVRKLRELANTPVMQGIAFLNVATPEGLTSARDSLLVFIEEHHLGEAALTPPCDAAVEKMFLWLWCQDLGQIGVVSDAPKWDEWESLTTMMFKVDHLLYAS
jgi:hypothetical protein